MLKDEILKKLSDGEYVSGQTIAEELNVSRSAVWKAINALKSEGYDISGTNRAGYILRGKDVLSPEELSACGKAYAEADGIENPFPSLDVKCFATIDSTNNEAKRTAIHTGKNTLIAAEEQTCGRGRSGKSFYSPDKTGAYFTLALHGATDFSNAVKVTSLAAVAVCRALEKLTGLSPSIKWVNDVYLGDKKVCGILTEAVTDIECGNVSDIIIGIGINIKTENFPKEIPNAGSIGGGFTRSALISAVVCEFFSALPSAKDNAHIPYYRAHGYLTGKDIEYFVSGERKVGKALDIDDNGGLIVQTPIGNVTLTSGEVTVRKL